MVRTTRAKLLLACMGLLAGFPGAVMAGGGALAPLVHDIGMSLLVAGVLAVVFHRLKIPTIAAFLVAGFIAGPGGAELVQDNENIPIIAELGLVLLLFVIGLELDLPKVFSSGRIIMVSGLLQFPLSVILGFGIAKLLFAFGVSALGQGFAPLYLGIVLAASSTLLVVKLFQESFQLDTTAGRVSLGMLIFQDIWAIVVIAVQPNFANPEIGPILSAFVGIAILVGFVFVITRYLLPLIFRWIATSPELLLVAGVGWCFGAVFLGGSLDLVAEAILGYSPHISVGPGMSALIAGAGIASLPYSGDVMGKVGVVKDFFVILFFVGLGMGIPVPEGPDVLLLALVFALASIAIRYLVFLPLLYFNGLDRRNATVASTRLAQVSEFALVIVYGGYVLGHVDALFNSATIFAFVLTALVTPVLYRYADDLYTRLEPLLDRLGFRTPMGEEDEEEEGYALAVLGFHRVASSLLYEIRQQRPEMLEKMLVVDFNVHMQQAIASQGPRVRYGDLANPETLHHAGVDKARVVLISVQDDVLKGTSNRQLVREVRHLNPNAVIIANAIELAESARLYEEGADFVYMSRVDSAQRLLEPIALALNGSLDDYRLSRDARDGKLHERAEVIA